MSDMCAVQTCGRDGRHEIDDESRLCLAHAQKWDKEEDARLERLTELHLADPGATNEDLWAAHKAEWLGAQQ